MIERYEKREISDIWCDENKLNLWQNTELAVIQAREELAEIPSGTHAIIWNILRNTKIDVEWWKARDEIIHHDLNAFLEERIRHLPSELQKYFHEVITSYDTEEAPFATMLKQSLKIVFIKLQELEEVLVEMAKKYRYTIMNGRTHGQEAEMQTFGKRCLTWLKELWVSKGNLLGAAKNLKYSKISGAIGNYGSINPAVEKRALEILGFIPFYGATQIMPRVIYAPVAQGLAGIVSVLNNIALAIRLGARSGRPIYQEPFAKLQKGSSAMPHKKNTIQTEQIKGMERLARAYAGVSIENVETWEERAIEQSCAERIIWPDLFHAVVHSLGVMIKVMEGLKVYPDNMLLEIYESRGCYASAEAKEFLKERGIQYNLDAEDGYRIIQLAAFNAFDPQKERKMIRETIPTSFAEVDNLLNRFRFISEPLVVSIEDRIINCELYAMTDQLAADEKIVANWNSILGKIFSDENNRIEWHKRFQPSYLLRNETKLYKEILGID